MLRFKVGGSCAAGGHLRSQILKNPTSMQNFVNRYREAPDYLVSAL